MLMKIFIAVVASLMLCTATAAHAQDTDKPVLVVETFKTVDDTQKFLGEYCSDVITEKLVNKTIFVVVDSELRSQILEEITEQLNDGVSGKVVSYEKLEPAYLVKGSIEIQTAEASFAKAIIDFELVDANTDELVWGRRVWHTEPTGNEKFLPITIRNAIYRTADKVVNRLTADIEAGKLILN